jgi:AcrR family transcriptional regulator
MRLSATRNSPRRTRATRRPTGERRLQIVQAAMAEFALRSYREVGTVDIARRVGVSEPTIYRHFQSKLEIYLSALDHSTAIIDDAWQAIADRAPTALDALRVIGRWSFEQLRDDPPHLALRARALVETSEPAAIERLRTHFEASRRMIERLYRAAQDAGELPAALDVRARAWAFMGIGALLDRTQFLGLTAGLDATVLRHLIASVLPELGGPPGKPSSS